jgi:predicted GNAT family acetyltransferase
MSSDHAVTVTDVPEEHRFVVVQEGRTAELVYRVEGERLVLIHTEVPDALGGRGIAAALVQAAVTRAAKEGLTVVPWCPYARKWLRDHADAAEGITIDWTLPSGVTEGGLP